MKKNRKGIRSMKVSNPSKNIDRFLLLLILIGIPFLLISCNPEIPNTVENQPETTVEFISKTDFLLNTVVTINLYDKQDMSLINGSFDIIRKYEAIYSRTEETSELYRLNHGLAPNSSEKPLTYTVSSELADVIQDALSYSKRSEGAFDLTIAPISSLWDFHTSSPALPDETVLNHALDLVDYSHLQLNGTNVTFAAEGVGIDLGAIAKGYIADRVKEYLLANGVKSALINLGGNLLCIGTKPNQKPFHIGIQKPYADRNETIATMEISDLSVVSSGVYERFFELDGKIYHHILNPRTGYPYDNGLISVTIISEKSVDGDGLSTSCFALGLEKGLQLINRIPNTYAVFITEDYQLHYSEGFEDAITLLP